MQFNGISTKEVIRFVEMLPSKKGQVISHNLVLNNRCDMRIFSFDSGEEVGMQTSKADIMYWILEGSAGIQNDGDDRILNKGEFIVMSRDIPHGIKAITPIKVMQIGVYEKGKKMGNFIKNIEHEKVTKIDEVLEYEDKKVASMTLAQNEKMSLTLMSFDKNEGISTHAAGGDAMVQVLDGTVEITIDKESYLLNKGEAIVMPADIPHSLKAVERFKMLLTVVKP